MDAIAGQHSRTPIMVAAEINRFSIICILLKRGVDLSIQDIHAQKILHIVAQQGNVETAEVQLTPSQS